MSLSAPLPRRPIMLPSKNLPIFALLCRLMTDLPKHTYQQPFGLHNVGKICYNKGITVQGVAMPDLSNQPRSATHAPSQKYGDSPSHNHRHGHSHHHHAHSHAPNNQRILWLSFAIITGFMLIEAITGKLFGSLALLADAGHMLNDSLSLALAGLAVWVQGRGKHGDKLSLWLALVNGISLLVIAVWVVVEAVQRFYQPQPIDALPVLGVAVVGLIVNIGVMKLMQYGEHDNLNMQAAYAHVIADALGSLAVIVASLALLMFGWQWVDALASLLVALVVGKSGVSVTWQAVRQLLHKDGQLHGH